MGLIKHEWSWKQKLFEINKIFNAPTVRGHDRSDLNFGILTVESQKTYKIFKAL